MDAERVPFEAQKERSRVRFGGFRLPAEAGAAGFIPWGSTRLSILIDWGFLFQPRPTFFMLLGDLFSAG